MPSKNREFIDDKTAEMFIKIIDSALNNKVTRILGSRFFKGCDSVSSRRRKILKGKRKERVYKEALCGKSLNTACGELRFALKIYSARYALAIFRFLADTPKV